MTEILLVISILVQLTVVGTAIWFFRVAGRQWSWGLMAAAVGLLAVRGGLTLAQALQSEMAAHPDLLARKFHQRIKK